jgi:hypothetical protein
VTPRFTDQEEDADQREASARLDDLVDLALDRLHEADVFADHRQVVAEHLDELRRRVAEAGFEHVPAHTNEEEHEGNQGGEGVEGDRPRHEEDVVLVGLVYDAAKKLEEPPTPADR